MVQGFRAEDSGSWLLKLAHCKSQGASLTGHLATTRCPPRVKDRDRGEPRGSSPPTPPYVRVRIRRVRKITPLNSIQQIDASPVFCLKHYPPRPISFVPPPPAGPHPSAPHRKPVPTRWFARSPAACVLSPMFVLRPAPLLYASFRRRLAAIALSLFFF